MDQEDQRDYEEEAANLRLMEERDYGHPFECDDCGQDLDSPAYHCAICGACGLTCGCGE